MFIMTVWGRNNYYYLCFTNEKIETQKKVTCPKSHSRQIVKPTLQLSLVLSSALLPSGTGCVRHRGSKNHTQSCPQGAYWKPMQCDEPWERPALCTVVAQKREFWTLPGSLEKYPLIPALLLFRHQAKNPSVTKPHGPSHDPWYPLLKTHTQIPGPWSSLYTSSVIFMITFLTS